MAIRPIEEGWNPAIFRLSDEREARQFAREGGEREVDASRSLLPRKKVQLHGHALEHEPNTVTSNVAHVRLHGIGLRCIYKVRVNACA